MLSAAAPMPILAHGSAPARVDWALSTASHVFLRVDAVRWPLVPPYEGPFAVVSRNNGEKSYVILKNGKNITVAVDRLKPAHSLPVSLPSPALPVPAPVVPVPVPAALVPFLAEF